MPRTRRRAAEFLGIDLAGIIPAEILFDPNPLSAGSSADAIVAGQRDIADKAPPAVISPDFNESSEGEIQATQPIQKKKWRCSKIFLMSAAG